MIPSWALSPLLLLCVVSATLLGGYFAIHFRSRLPLVMGFTAGVLIGLVGFDLLPEIMRRIGAENLNPRAMMAALVAGFLAFHTLEKLLVIHHGGGGAEDRKHPRVGALSALALCGHSFMDGVGIGLGFQVSRGVGLVVAFAVISHDFIDGMNTVVVLLNNRNTPRQAVPYLALNACVPVLGLLSTSLFHPPPFGLVLYLSFFSGFLLYIGASHILPEAHHEGSSVWTLLLTIFGSVLSFALSAYV